jgi:hypothetical protein
MRDGLLPNMVPSISPEVRISTAQHSTARTSATVTGRPTRGAVKHLGEFLGGPSHLGSKTDGVWSVWSVWWLPTKNYKVYHH